MIYRRRCKTKRRKGNNSGQPAGGTTTISVQLCEYLIKEDFDRAANGSSCENYAYDEETQIKIQDDSEKMDVAYPVLHMRSYMTLS